MEYAVVASGGKQYKVTPGMVLDIEKTETQADGVIFDKVLLLVSDADIMVGKPFIEEFFIKAKLIGAKKGEKVRVSKFKAKAKYRKTVGFRHSLLTIEILPFGEPARNASQRVAGGAKKQKASVSSKKAE